jgi:lipoprotein NlpI
MHAYERALQANPNSIAAMNAIGMLLKGREAFDKALEFFRAIVQLDQNNGEAWGNLGMSRHRGTEVFLRLMLITFYRPLLPDDRKFAKSI